MKNNRILSLLLVAVMLVPTLLSGMMLAASAEEATPPPTYVTDGLVSLYSGTNSGEDPAVWTDLVGENHFSITTNGKNYFTEEGLAVEGAQHHFPQAIVDLVNSQAFTVEIAFGDFTSIGSDFNTFMNSSNDNFALFRRNSNDNLEFKWAGKAGESRPKVGDGLSLIDNGVISVTFEVGGSCCIYVDGSLVAKVASDTAMGANNLFIGHASAGKNFSTVYKSIRFYDRALTPEEVANNARVDGATVVDPAEKPKTNITVAQPQTNIVGDISMIREVNSKAEMESMIAAKNLPATAIYTVNDKLEALDDQGAAFATVSEIFAAHDYKIIPAFRVTDKAAADALVKHLKDIRFYDCFVVSKDPAIVKDFRTALPQVSGVIDYTEVYENALELPCLDIRRSMKENNGTVALLPDAVCVSHTQVQYLYDRQVNVWILSSDGPDELMQYHNLLSGAIGVVSDQTDALLDIACNKLPKNTLTRVPLNIGHRGIPANAPENTVEGSLHAYEQGATVIELDIYLTKDGEVVVMHDGTTGRTCDKDLNVEASTLAQLKELYVNKGYENNSKYKNCRIPTLNEYLEAFKGKDCQLFIEIKSGKTAIVKAMKACIEEYDMYDQCSVITFNEPIMAAMRKDYPEMSVGALCSGYMNGLDPEADFRSAMTFIGKYNATLNPSYGGYEANDLRAALMRGISIYPWTFRGDLNTYKNHFLWGYSGLTGDNANVFKRLVKGIQYHAAEEANPILIDVTYYSHTTKTENPSVVISLSGDDKIREENGVFTAIGGSGNLLIIPGLEVKIGGETYTLFGDVVSLDPMGGIPEPETETAAPVTEPVTEPVTNEVTEPTPDTNKPADTSAESSSTPVESETEAPKGGCGSAIGGMATLIMTGFAVMLGKKKDN